MTQLLKKVQLSETASGKVILKIELHTAILGVSVRLGALTTRLVLKVKQLAEFGGFGLPSLTNSVRG